MGTPPRSLQLTSGGTPVRAAICAFEGHDVECGVDVVAERDGAVVLPVDDALGQDVRQAVVEVSVDQGQCRCPVEGLLDRLVHPWGVEVRVLLESVGGEGGLLEPRCGGQGVGRLGPQEPGGDVGSCADHFVTDRTVSLCVGDGFVVQ